ncbi:hypothetical protein F0P96_00395 [Hymenobacter busanensis]|uniref:Uncharacterized protein n=1 Tax=Hymenobacter busanensis TaxID=2607656 RepID=A0A7L4ZV71_9BACT|nr:hypothetical protein [Hymenobacter busanensis]KAA9339127.1 hypothetical protein F0P96_00395 [Hymenobacter busanensis]QHJ07111.1 hypothetical protein GUY19_07355 [Hymenobacter busanensis]
MSPEQHVPLYAVLDQAANNAQRTWRGSYVRSLLVLGIIGVLAELKEVSPLLFRPEWHKWVKLFVILISVVGALYEIFYHIQHKSRFGYWTRLRAKAERVKSEAWFYLFDVAPASGDTGYTEAQWQRFQQQLTTDDVAAGFVDAVGQDSLTSDKAKFVQLPLAQQAQLYHTNRVIEQHRYFASRTRRLAQRLRRHKQLVVVLLLLAIAWAIGRAVAILYPHIATPVLAETLSEFNLFVILISIIGLFKAYIEVENVEYLLNRYQRMEHQLSVLLPNPTVLDNGTTLQSHVQEVERILLSQTQDWETQRLS